MRRGYGNRSLIFFRKYAAFVTGCFIMNPSGITPIYRINPIG